MAVKKIRMSAEGFKDLEKQLEYLKEYGCDVVQGYVFDKPLPRHEFEDRLETGYEEQTD